MAYLPTKYAVYPIVHVDFHARYRIRTVRKATESVDSGPALGGLAQRPRYRTNAPGHQERLIAQRGHGGGAFEDGIPVLASISVATTASTHSPRGMA
jgi:hypothetical protein